MLLQMPSASQPNGTTGSGLRWLWCNTNLPHHICSLSHGIPNKESEGGNASWPSTQSTKHQIFLGWPNAMRSIQESIHPFQELQRWTIHRRWFDLQIPEASNPTIPEHTFIKDLHIDHVREEKTLPRAQECIYWPGITGHIKEYIKACNICQLMKPSQ